MLDNMERSLRRYLPAGRFAAVPSVRSRVMRAVKSVSNSTTEKRLRYALVRSGIRGWKLRTHGVPGTPDFVFEEARVVVFTDGCFWHGCKRCRKSRVKTNSEYWNAKMALNRAKDRKHTKTLQENGWTVVRVWEHELRASLDRVVARIKATLDAVSIGPRSRLWKTVSRSVRV